MKYCLPGFLSIDWHNTAEENIKFFISALKKSLNAHYFWSILFYSHNQVEYFSFKSVFIPVFLQ